MAVFGWFMCYTSAIVTNLLSPYMRRFVSGIGLKTSSMFLGLALGVLGLLSIGGQASAANLGDVIISEFNPRPSVGSEWIELMGTVSSTFDFSSGTHWIIECTRMDPTPTTTITLSGTLPDHGILVFTDTGKLNDAGGILTLKDEAGNAIYVMSYGDTDPPGAEPHVALPPADGTAYFDLNSSSWSTSATPLTYGWFNGPPAPSIAFIVAQINAAGITTNLGSVTNPSAASSVYFSTSTGRITYGSTLNFSDYSTKVLLQDLGAKMDFGNAFVGFDAQTSEQLRNMGATIDMYGMTGLGFLSQPYIQVATDLGTIIPSTSSTYPALTGLSFGGGTFSFNASHFTQFGAYKVLNQTTGQGYNTIAAAVGAAGIGNSIAVSAGTYNEDVTVATSVTLTGSGSPSVTKLTFATSTVTVSGLSATTTAVSSTGRIVDAVAAVATGGTIILANANFAETVTLNKAMTVTGQGAGMTTTTKFVLTANPITISGIDVPTLDVSGSGRIGDAAAAIGASGTINVAAGTYAENVTIGRNVAINGTGNPTVNKFTLNSQPIYCSGITANTVDVGSGGKIADGVACVTGSGTLNVLGTQNYGESVTVNKVLTITGPGAGTATTTKLTFTLNPITVSGLDVPTIDVSGSGLIVNAISAVKTGGTVNVSAGSHSESVSINKSVSLVGSGSTVSSFNLSISPISILGVSSSQVNVASGGKVQDALNLVNTNGIVRLAAGTYTENLTISKVVDLGGGGNHPVIAAADANNHTITVAANGVTISDITAQGATGVGKAAVYISGFGSLDFTSGSVRNSDYGIYALNSNGNYFRYSNAVNNANTGLYFNNAVSGTITMSTLGSNGYGAFVTGGSSGLRFYENTIQGNSNGMRCVTTTSADRNWWGDATGPNNTTSNPGGLGDDVTDLVVYRPFYTDSGRTTLSVETVDAANIGTLITSGVFQIPSGTPSTSTPSVTVLEQVTINAGGNQIIIPAGTVITKDGGGNFDATQLAAAAVTASLASGLAGSTVDGVVQWGIPGLGLQFSPAITVRIDVGTGLNGNSLNIQRSSSLATGWTTDGLGSTTCSVTSGICSFTTTKASYFGSSHTPSSSGGGSSGGGGVGGSTYIAYTPVYQTYSKDADRAKNVQNLVNIGVEIHALVKLQDDGDKTTQEDTAVYYIGTDGRRHAFPNDKVFFTWYLDFSGVKVLGADKLASIPLGANVHYKPGVRMVKFTTDPKVYVVSLGGQLRWIQTEALAKALYGDGWNARIDDLSDAFYVNYSFGAPIAAAADFSVSAQSAGADKISTDLGL